jgi:hypothetical protein
MDVQHMTIVVHPGMGGMHEWFGEAACFAWMCADAVTKQRQIVNSTTTLFCSLFSKLLA